MRLCMFVCLCVCVCVCVRVYVRLRACVRARVRVYLLLFGFVILTFVTCASSPKGMAFMASCRRYCR